MLIKGQIKSPKEQTLEYDKLIKGDDGKYVIVENYNIHNSNNMNLLELFSGTGNVGTIAKSLGFNVISLELKNADINSDILEWDYKQVDRNHFDFIWSSPPCTEYSRAKTTGIRNIEYANSIVLKTIEIINYFNPNIM